MLTLLALFAAGHLLISLFVAVALRFARREPDLAARATAIFDLNDRAARMEAAQAELEASKADMTRLADQLGKASRRLKNQIPLDDPPSAKWSFAAFALVLAEMEAVVFVLLTAPVAFFGLPAAAWTFLAPVVSASAILAFHVMMGAVFGDRQRPARTLRRAKTGTVVFGSAIVFAMWTILSGRNLTDASLIQDLTAAALMVLAALLSVGAAFCTIVATTLFETQQAQREVERLEALQLRYERHLELVQRDLARLDGSGSDDDDAPQEEPVRTGNPVPASIVTAALLVLAILGGGVTAVSAQTPPAGMPAGGPAPAMSFARQGACEVGVDLSSSVARERLQRGLDALAANLAALVDVFGCKVLRLTPFSSDFGFSIDETVVPVIVDPAPDCAGAAEGAVRVRAAGVVYPRAAEQLRREAIAKCIADKQSAVDDSRRRRAAAITAAAARLRRFGAVIGTGPCTALAQSTRRMLMRSQVAVILTDGISTCRLTGPAGSVSHDARLLFLVVPPESATDDVADLVLNRLAALEQHMSGSRAVLVSEATPSFWRGLSR